MEQQITISNLLMGFLGRTIPQVEREGFMGYTMRRYNVQELGANMVAYEYAVSQENLFMLFIDHDENDRIVIQRTYWPNWQQLWYMIKKQAIPGLSPGFRSNGFYVENPKLGKILIENLTDSSGETAICASFETI
ncbi:MAG: hypothetical protein LKI65_04475 [Prevotella sp.]|jgi:hypothetical protein|nr:hypothetical protein [Prevotella sp.]